MAKEPGQVVVVGAGPAGMALAYLLARRGVSVTVLETHHDFARAFRGEGVQRSGIDAFRQMGLGPQFNRLPHTEVHTIEFYFDGRLVVRADAAGLGRAQVRAVTQPAMLQLVADEAGKYPSFRLEFGVTVRDLVREGGRVVGVRASTANGPREYRADLVVGADGRNAATRKHSGLGELSGPKEGFDILWLKVPYPDGYPDRATGLAVLAANGSGGAYPTPDGQIQVAFIIPKGGFTNLRARSVDQWTEELIGVFPRYLADHLRAHRDAMSGVTLLDVVCGRLTEWTLPGLLLIGDAAHPMSPVGGQGLNIALRDALVAANHLVPVLTAGGASSAIDGGAIDAAARRVRDERWPEIVAVQEMQRKQARVLYHPDRWRTRLLNRLLPWLVRTGLVQRLQRKQFQVMSEGALEVRLGA
jgi:2-polyprenyl-6-methoxyphenol hydroxylase-like FAD-dependent oxidoreductase